MNSPSIINLVLLHGFGGSSEDWEAIQKFLSENKRNNFSFRFFCPTLPGHQRELSCTELKIKSFQEAATFYENEILKNFQEPFYLCGYSMGGRLALQMLETDSLKFSSKVRGLILLSAGLGDDSPAERETRKKNDARWATMLRENPELFWKKWYELPLFKSLKDMALRAPQSLAKWEKSRLGHEKMKLAETMEFFSPSQHGKLLKGLKKQAKLLYLAGEKDQKYLEISEKIAKELPLASVERISGVGHVLPLEAPEICAEKILSWIEKCEEKYGK